MLQACDTRPLVVPLQLQQQQILTQACVDAHLAYLAARAKQDVASLLPPSALHATATSLCGPLQLLIKQHF